MHQQRVVGALVLLVIGAFAIGCALAAASQDASYEASHVADNNSFQWAELSDESFSSPSLVEESSSQGTSEAVEEEAAEPDYSAEMMELRAGLNIDSLIEGREFDDAKHDAALMEMEMSSALSPEASPADFFRFARTHSRLYATEKGAAAAFAAFKQNKKAAAELNAALGLTTEAEAMFAATGPMSSLSPAAFKSKILVAKNPRGRSRGRKVRISKGVPQNKNTKSAKQSQSSAKNSKAQKSAAQKPTSAANKSRSVKPKTNAKGALQPQQQASGAGHAAGFAGSSGGMSGKTGGQSGKTGGQSGKTGGQSGKTGGQSGKTGGQSGKTGGKSGKQGGKSGKQGGQSGEQGGKSGKQGGKSGKTGGGGVVYSSVANGTVAATNVKALNGLGASGAVGYTNADAAAKLGLSAASLRQMVIGHGIGEVAYNQALATLQKSQMISRPLQFRAMGGFVPQIPVQSNDCGSCWAIAAQQSLQRYWASAAFPGVLSIQQLLDCARTADSKGCRGGTPMDAFEFWATNIAAGADDYPDVMKDQECKKPPYRTTKVAYPSAGWEMLVPECTSRDPSCSSQVNYEIMALAFTRTAGFQPPIAYVDASRWQNYKGGIFPPSLCKSTMEAGNHVVQIVGSGIDNLGIPYWLIDNFWGESWGEGGRIRLPFGINACGLFNFIIYATPPPFATNVKGQGSAPFPNTAPTPYVPKPIQLKKVDTSASHVLDVTTSRLAAAQSVPQVTLLPSGVPSQVPASTNSAFVPQMTVNSLTLTSANKPH